MKVTNIDTLLDGGTIVITMEEPSGLHEGNFTMEFHIDNRIHTKTPGVLYWGPPETSFPVIDLKVINGVLNATAKYIFSE